MPETTLSMVDTLNKVGAPLTSDQQEEIDLWNKGRSLGFVVNSQGWDVIREMMSGYVTKEVDRLLSVDPGNRDEVLAAHAVAFAASRIFTVFVEDVQRAVNAARSTPPIVKERLARISPVPPESL